MEGIPFNRPYLTGQEVNYVRKAIESLKHHGNQDWTERCLALLKERCKREHIFLTPSGTAALEMGALLLDLKPKDEVILPSYTFSSTANAVVLRGAHPVFCEVDPSTMNMDPTHAASLVTKRTKLLLPIDYAGIPCDIDAITRIAEKANARVMVDAAQSLGSRTNGRPCGSFGAVSTFSFHESKNISCGEGGALIINDPDLVERASYIQEKGTDRTSVIKGLKSKYRWVDKGSSFLLSNIQGAMLYAQLEAMDEIISLRSKITAAYRELFAPYAHAGCVSFPHPPPHVEINHHKFFVIFDSADKMSQFLDLLKTKKIVPYIGYMPLHSSPMGRSLGYKPEDLPLTESLASRIARLPFYTALADDGLGYCVDEIGNVMRQLYGF